MIYQKLLAIIIILISGCIHMSGKDSYRELITLIDGTQIYGYISKDDLNSGTIEVTSDWTITSVPINDIDINTTNYREYQLDSDIKDWMTSMFGHVPEIVNMGSITMTGDQCNNDYLLYDQVLSPNSESFDKIILEYGDIIKYADISPRKFTLDWIKVDRIDRSDLDDNIIIEEIIDLQGQKSEGFIETQVLRHHRVLRTPDGRKITYLPKNISSIIKKTMDPKVSLLSASPIIECLELENNVGIDRVEGVIIENNRKDKYFIILTPSENEVGEKMKKVRYVDTKAIHYYPK